LIDKLNLIRVAGLLDQKAGIIGPGAVDNINEPLEDLWNEDRSNQAPSHIIAGAPPSLADLCQMTALLF